MEGEAARTVYQEATLFSLRADTNIRSGLGEAIREERSALGISQEALAKRSGLHRTYISDIERGLRNPTVNSIQRIACALHVSVAKLFE